MQLEQLRMQMLSLSTYHVHYFKNKIISMKFKSIRGIDWIYNNLIWSAGWTCRNLHFHMFSINSYSVLQLIPTDLPRSGTNLGTLRISRRWKISNLSWNCTRFANLCCCTAVQATTKNTSFGVTEVTPVVLWKRTFFRKVVVRAGCRNLAHTSSTLDSLFIAKISVKLKFTTRGFLA